MTHDRMHAHDFTLSHEFLAIMLGVHGPTVSAVAARLQQAGLIRYVYGRVTVLDRTGLERASCECYGIRCDVLGFALKCLLPDSAPTSTAITVLSFAFRWGVMTRPAQMRLKRGDC